MANSTQVLILNEGVKKWNLWRNHHPEITPNLSNADLSGMNLSDIQLQNTNLSRATLTDTNFLNANLSDTNFSKGNFSNTNFTDAILTRSNLTNAEVSDVDFTNADLSYANLSKILFESTRFSNAHLHQAIITGSDLYDPIFSGADLSEANLEDSGFYNAIFVGANLEKANLKKSHFFRSCFDAANLSDADLTETELIQSSLIESNLQHTTLINTDFNNTLFVQTNISGSIMQGCKVYGVSAWDLVGKPKIMKNLVINTSNADKNSITVDNIEIAQFIYLLLYDKKIREVIDEVTSKVVLILGRFTDERLIILEAIRDELRSQNFVPVLFVFEKPKNRDIIETVITLAGMARFVIADITDAKTVIQELDTIVPNIPSLPVQPIVLSSSDSVWAGYSHLKRKSPNLLETFRYEDLAELKKSFKTKVIEPANDLRKILIET